LRASYDDHDHDSGNVHDLVHDVHDFVHDVHDFVHDVHDFVHDFDGLIYDDNDDEHQYRRKHEHAQHVDERESDERYDDIVRSHDNRGDRWRIDAAHEGATSAGTCETGEGCACDARRCAKQPS
jgi:hypothetical protein